MFPWPCAMTRFTATSSGRVRHHHMSFECEASPKLIFNVIWSCSMQYWLEDVWFIRFRVLWHSHRLHRLEYLGSTCPHAYFSSFYVMVRVLVFGLGSRSVLWFRLRFSAWFSSWFKLQYRWWYSLWFRVGFGYVSYRLFDGEGSSADVQGYVHSVRPWGGREYPAMAPKGHQVIKQYLFVFNRLQLDHLT